MNSLRPETYDSLTGLRFVLSIWIAVFHLGDMYDPQGFGAWAIMRAGAARVDVFFVLSGFVLTHIYWARSKASFQYRNFLRARFARLYPLHLLALGLLCGLVVAAHVVRQGAQTRHFTLTGLIANLALLQAWAIPGANVWNFPAWTISAEFFGYLIFPLLLIPAVRLRSRPWVFVCLSLGVVLTIDLLFRQFLGRTLTRTTVDLGILRGASVMWVGVAARVLFERLHLTSLQALVVIVFGAAIALGGAMMALPTAVVALGGAMLVIGLAARDITRQANAYATGLDHPAMVKLGGWSYAIFILHVPIFMAMENVAKILGTNLPINPVTVLIMVSVLIGLAAVAHIWVEEPARKWLRGPTANV